VPSAPSATSSSRSCCKRARWTARSLSSSAGCCLACVAMAASIASIVPRVSAVGPRSLTGAKEPSGQSQRTAWRVVSAARRRASRPAGSIRSWTKVSIWAARFATRPELPVSTLDEVCLVVRHRIRTSLVTITAPPLVRRSALVVGRLRSSRSRSANKAERPTAGVLEGDQGIWSWTSFWCRVAARGRPHAWVAMRRRLLT
jgi:hypothetical protein